MDDMVKPDLSQVISEAVGATLSQEFVTKQIEDRVARLVKDAIDQSLRTWSDSGKVIEAAIKDALRVNRLDLPSYGDMVSSMVRSKIEELTSEVIAGRLADDMEELLRLAPKTVKLSKIAEDMCRDHADDGAYGDVITVIVERTEYGSVWLYLDDEEHRHESEKYQCPVRLLVSNDGTIASGWVKEAEINKARSFGKPRIERPRLSLGRYGLCQLIMAYYACGTVIDIDEDNVCTSVGDY